MSIIAFKDTKVLVQGITGSAARHHTSNMLAYGTKIVAGVRPGAGGQEVEGVPVFDSVAEACQSQPLDASILFIPAAGVKAAALDAMENGIKLVVIVTEHVPLQDAMVIMEAKRRLGATVIGPNTPGMISPPENTMLGFVPARYFQPGPIGLASRSGTLTYEFVSRLTAAGLGQSTCIGVGGDRIVGLRFRDALQKFQDDPQTEAVVLVGEIGGTMEEEAAELVASGAVTKPVVTYVAGHTAPEGTKVGHAGAIVSGTRGTMKSKLTAFERAGIRVALQPAQVVELLKDALK
ncbi:MAG: succinate--CoA ligase subunit alpha [Deltaproteobacteria bacterium]|nr:succinate--CoA ligase subunit alpha [Deltaproteobacteria bacterium]